MLQRSWKTIERNANVMEHIESIGASMYRMRIFTRGSNGNGNEFGTRANRRKTRMIRSWRSDGKTGGSQRGETEKVHGRSPRIYR